MIAKYIKSLLKLALITVLVLSSFHSAIADNKSKLWERHPELQIPGRLKGRVGFWIDVFGIYTKAQVIIHHRRFPQVRFALLDIEAETKGMNDVQFDSYKDRALKAKLKEVREDITFLASGEVPKTSQQKNIEKAMQAFGPGNDKYIRIVKDPELVRGQSGIRDKMAEAVQRSGRYLPIIEDIFVNEFGLPVELTRLPFVESSFDYKAYSSVAAAGIWQFMPKTARNYMRVTSTIDERLDPVESTRAAARYLKSAYSRLGTWPLALTSYNHGVGGVLNKVRKYGTTDISSLIENNSETPPFGFASGNFFPSFLAAKEIYAKRKEFFPNLSLEPPLRMAVIKLSKPSLLNDLLKRIGASENELRKYNYALSERIWDSRSPLPVGYNLKVPLQYEAKLISTGFGESSENFSVDASSVIDNKSEPISVALANQVKEQIQVNDRASENEIIKTENVIDEPKNSAKPSSYKVKAGDTLYSIARVFEVSVSDLKLANNIKGSSVFVGKVLIIPDKPLGTPVVETKKQESGALVKLYTVKKGDTLSTISKRMNVSLAKLVAKNGLSAKKPNIKVGQVLRIPL